MTSPPRRRPLPALVFLVALTLLTALVWWRVLSRSDSHAVGAPACPTSQPSTGSPAPAKVLPRPADVHVTVLNSTNRAGLAGRTATALGKLGFKIDKVSNDSGHPEITGVAQIRYLPTAKSDALLLSYYVPGAQLVPVAAGSTTTTTPALVVSLGAKFTKPATAAVASKALRDAGHTVATAAPTTSATSVASGASSSAASCAP